ncbi:MAG: type II toxin-antitoxin system VapC family toxin [Cellulomonadaceae bacterium]|nr:type II toxin-antitoxin system VapC family toxin [Cellulomonadaceae bacterium]
MVRLILDTTVLIDLERDGSLPTLINDNADIAVAAVSIAEFAYGVIAARRRRDSRAENSRRQVLDAVMRRVHVLSYTRDTAIEHAALLDHCRASGTPRGAHDLVIAAHACETGRAIVTSDAKARFDDLPGVHVAQVHHR